MFSVVESQKQLPSQAELVRAVVQRIRNPLNALQLNVDNLENEISELNTEEKKDILEKLRRIRNTVTELDSFVSEVLRFADLPRPQITAVNVNALVREVEIFLKPESSKKELTVKMDLQENLPEVGADPVQIKQGVLNVLLNAIQACSIKGSITLATEATKSDQMVIAVKDNGEGIPLAHRDRIFEPFFSTKECASGLGLSLALQIVKIHQGRISFTSEVGKGTTFLISLPTRVVTRK